MKNAETRDGHPYQRVEKEPRPSGSGWFARKHSKKPLPYGRGSMSVSILQQAAIPSPATPHATIVRFPMPAPGIPGLGLG